MSEAARPTNGAATERTDVAVVGAGPIGLELAVALKRAGIDYLHFDAKQIGYTVSWFAPRTRFFSSNERIAIAGVPAPDGGPGQVQSRGVPHVPPADRAAVRPEGPHVRAGGRGRAGPAGPIGGFVLTTRPAGGERTTHARRLVLVTGGTDRPRLLNVPGENLPHVSHYFDDPHRYFRKRLLIVGGKNSAVEAALRCHNAGAHVSISYRRAALPHKSIKYWLLPEITGLIEAGEIEPALPHRAAPRSRRPT